MLPSQIAALSNSELDATFDMATRAGDSVTAGLAAQEIVDRLSTPFAYVRGLMGVDSFPLYQAATGFDQSVAAQDSTSASISNLADSVTAGAKKTALLVIVAAFSLGALYVIIKANK